MKEHFERILGAGNASENEQDLIAYSYDASELTGKARAILFPSQDEQLRLIMTYCNRSNIDVVVRGNGGGMVGGAVPQNSVVISMQGFDRVHAINMREGWVKVDAGVTIAELNEALLEHEVRYALEPFTSQTTTIGAFLASNGTTRHGMRYGRARDTAIELEIMDGTGKYIVTQKDKDDFIGFEGTTGIIIRAKLKIVPIKTRSADVFFFDTLSQAVQKAFELEERQDVRPIAIEYLDQAAATYAGINTKHTLIVEYEGETGSAKHENYISLMNKRANARKRLGEQGYVLLEDGEATPDMREQAIRWCLEKNLPVIAHISLGIIHPHFKREQAADIQKWYEYLSMHECSVNGQFGYGLKKKQHYPQNLKTRFRQIKERNDYNNVLSRGKVSDYI